MTSHKLVRLATLAVLAAGSLANPVDWGHNYDFSIYWEEGCNTKKAELDVGSPLGEEESECHNLFIRAYEECDNGGVGGKIKVGCLVYQYDGGLG